ncbi:2-nitropropane dioxygenase [Fulvimarina pelagi HTCC2506]|uniref:Propionate 3-nitronate monooxygenase n=2 Tax=Fulvimarina pelagi TaxID=217511 RepID=Q0FZD6_9HYPH|nr:nitronate monooxygenase [Fulvimarina pelagi]EAU40342.1 2-nitropropane dioxygenase [Fulvimarina pelagi HTCC2506]BAT31379.1 2-nitropropane dioxygenase [Fulvimarina pelagi]
MRREILARISAFENLTGAKTPIGLAPMAGACPPALSIAVANAGGIGACGALLFGPDEIADWAESFRAGSDGPFIMNLWVPDSEPHRDTLQETQIREALSSWGPAVAADAGETPILDFDSQTHAIIEARPTAFSSIMGLPSQDNVEALKEAGLLWFATVTSVDEARQAEEAGADVIVAQASEAGGHRGSFDPGNAELQSVGALSLLPTIVDVVCCPVVAAGGIADARTAIAALTLGASAVQIGTGFLRTPEAGLNPAWADALAETSPTDTALTRGFSGRLGRAVRNRYVAAIEAGDIPDPAPYPIQRGLTAAMRKDAIEKRDIDRMQAWAGQSARLAQARPAGDILTEIAEDIETFLA